MTSKVRCPCCGQPWRADMEDRLPLFLLRQLAFEFVERETGLGPDELSSRRKTMRLTEARALFVWIARTFGTKDASYSRIGRWLHKEHSSIIHLWEEVIPRQREGNPDFSLLCGRFIEFAAEAKETLTCP